MPHRRFNPWLLLLVLIGLFFVLLTAWSLLRAQIPGRAVTAGYTAKLSPDGAADWERRGWTGSFSVEQRLFRCELRDGSGLPLSGAQGSLQLTGTAVRRLGLSLIETAPGRYQVELPAALAGLQSAQITLTRDQAQLVRNLQLQLAEH